MLGLGETILDIIEVLYELRENGIVMTTIVKHLQPSSCHYHVWKYIHSERFLELN